MFSQWTSLVPAGIVIGHSAPYLLWDAIASGEVIGKSLVSFGTCSLRLGSPYFYCNIYRMIYHFFLAQPGFKLPQLLVHFVREDSKQHMQQFEVISMLMVGRKFPDVRHFSFS